ncbi:MAG: hypothetical protein M0015_08580 [Betaproteobacteria bacterium]|nr:hypothetical protein [Betaproteobacteria bacterium]
MLWVLLGFGPAHAEAPAYPSFAPGLWRLATTMDLDGKQGTRQTTTCGDPTEGMRAIFVPEASASGCRSSAPVRRGNRYGISSDCGERGSSRIEVIVHSDESFTQVIDTRTGGTRVHETIEARRVGACKK